MQGMPLERADRLFMHPTHREAFQTLVQLIVDLRQCQSYADYYGFQQDLLGKVLEIQTHRAACTRVARRLRTGRTLPVDAPELRSGEDVHDPESWDLEADACERVDRQFRSVADAMAWRLFSYDRSVIIAFSRNDPPGPMVGKDGLAAERAFIEQCWRDEHSFVLLHDLTSCLHIGDATLFKSVGKQYEAYLYEIKTNPLRQETRQLHRNRLAEEAIRSGGPLPGDPDARIVTIGIPYKTHLSILRDAFTSAADCGVAGRKVPGGRTLVAADLRRGHELWSQEEFLDRTYDAQVQASKRAGILDVGHHVHFKSDDIVGRSPTQPPWAIYPLPPVVCANLIFDLAFYMVTVSSESLLDALRGAGITAQWVLPPNQPELLPRQPILRAFKGQNGIEMLPSDMQRLLLELVDISTWVKTIDALLTGNHANGHPWPLYTNEGKVWA